MMGRQYHFLRDNILTNGAHMGKGMGRRNNPKAAFSLDQILRHNDRIIGRPDHIARIHFQIILLRRQQHRTVLRSIFRMGTDDRNAVHGAGIIGRAGITGIRRLRCDSPQTFRHRNPLFFRRNIFKSA